MRLTMLARVSDGFPLRDTSRLISSSVQSSELSSTGAAGSSLAMKPSGGSRCIDAEVVHEQEGCPGRRAICPPIGDQRDTPWTFSSIRRSEPTNMDDLAHEPARDRTRPRRNYAENRMAARRLIVARAL